MTDVSPVPIVEWDERKREETLRIRGIDFVRAAKIFDSPVIERRDERKDYGEERLIALGEHDGDMLIVVYTWRGETRRIITAWRAGDEERRKYRALYPRGNRGYAGQDPS